jgi:hypothetical protein
MGRILNDTHQNVMRISKNTHQPGPAKRATPPLKRRRDELRGDAVQVLREQHLPST